MASKRPASKGSLQQIACRFSKKERQTWNKDMHKFGGVVYGIDGMYGICIYSIFDIYGIYGLYGLYGIKVIYIMPIFSSFP